MTTIEPFHVNGWTIKPCYQPTHGLPEEGVDLVHGAELYHYDTVGQAVLAAQRSHRESLGRACSLWASRCNLVFRLDQKEKEK